MQHVDLVKSMASRLGRRLPSQVEISELVSVGVVGLIEAANRYEPSLGVPFDAFASAALPAQVSRGDTNVSVNVTVQAAPGQEADDLGEAVAAAVRREVIVLFDRTGEE